VAPCVANASTTDSAVTSAAELRGELRIPPELPIIRASFVPEPNAAAALAGHRVLPFSGTARPHRFFDTLRAIGCDLTDECALPDHAPLSTALLGRLRTTAAARNALLVTTAKDAARLSASECDGVHVLPMQLHWLPGDAEQIDRLLDPHIGGERTSHQQRGEL
jgi:tetraacyldisaccharide 4'-kinase